MGMSEKRSLRRVVGPRSIQLKKTCGDFLCHAEVLKKHKIEKPKRRRRCAWHEEFFFVFAAYGPT